MGHRCGAVTGYAGEPRVLHRWCVGSGSPPVTVQDCAELDIAFEDILGRPQDLVKDMAKRLGLANKVGMTHGKTNIRDV